MTLPYVRGQDRSISPTSPLKDNDEAISNGTVSTDRRDGCGAVSG